MSQLCVGDQSAIHFFWINVVLEHVARLTLNLKSCCFTRWLRSFCTIQLLSSGYVHLIFRFLNKVLTTQYADKCQSALINFQNHTDVLTGVLFCFVRVSKHIVFHLIVLSTIFFKKIFFVFRELEKLIQWVSSYIY